MSKARCYYCNRVKDADEMTDIDVEEYDGGHRTELVCESCEKNPTWHWRTRCERCKKFVSTIDPNVRFHELNGRDEIDWDGYVHIVCPHKHAQMTSGGKE